MKIYLTGFILSVTFFACSKPVENTKPVIENITESVYAAGIVKAKNQYEVFSTVNGLISKILVTEGDTVNKGDALLIVQNETARLNKDNAQLSADYNAFNASQDKLNELKLNIDQAKNKMDNDGVLVQRQQNL